jgi:hypothetical protein
MNKKTSLKDIGETLDKFILDEKAEGLKYWNADNEESVKSSTKDSSNFELSWAGKLFKRYDPLKPCNSFHSLTPFTSAF